MRAICFTCERSWLITAASSGSTGKVTGSRLWIAAPAVLGAGDGGKDATFIVLVSDGAGVSLVGVQAAQIRDAANPNVRIKNTYKHSAGLVLAAYNKLESPSKKRESAEIELARKRLAEFRRRTRRKR